MYKGAYGKKPRGILGVMRIPERFILCVSGGRDLNSEADREAVFGELDKRIRRVSLLIQGECPTGADRWAREWLGGKSIGGMGFPADWKKNHLRAGPIRNSEMASTADCLLAFWDGQSSGTRNCIAEFKRRRKPVVVVPMKQFGIQGIESSND